MLENLRRDFQRVLKGDENHLFGYVWCSLNVKKIDKL